MFAVITEIVLKLWNRGIDIGVGVITSTISAGIVAVIAIVFWNWKKKRDLRFEADKQRQEHRIAAEEAAKVRLRESRDRRKRLVDERDTFLGAAHDATNQLAQAQVWDAYLVWLVAKELQHLPANLNTITTLWQWSSGLRGTTEANIAPNREHMVRMISGMELPPEE